jgi:hypothetical protein
VQFIGQQNSRVLFARTCSDCALFIAFRFVTVFLTEVPVSCYLTSAMPPAVFATQHSPQLQSATIQQQPQRAYLSYLTSTGQADAPADGANYYVYSPHGIFHQPTMPYVQPTTGASLPVAAPEDQVNGAMTSAFVYYVPAHQSTFSSAPISAGGPVPVWSAAAAGGLAVSTATAVGNCDPSMAVNGSELIPTTFNGVMVSPSSAVDVRAVAYGNHPVYVCQTNHDSNQQHLYQVPHVQQLQQQPHHMATTSVGSVDLAHQPRNPLINSTK